MHLIYTKARCPVRVKTVPGKLKRTPPQELRTVNVTCSNPPALALGAPVQGHECAARFNLPVPPRVPVQHPYTLGRNLAITGNTL